VVVYKTRICNEPQIFTAGIIYHLFERESLAAPGAFAGAEAVRCDMATPAITGAKLLRSGFENVTFNG